MRHGLYARIYLLTLLDALAIQILKALGWSCGLLGGS